MFPSQSCLTELCIQQIAQDWSWGEVSGVQADLSDLQRLQSLHCSWFLQLAPAFYSFHRTPSIQNAVLLMYFRTWVPLYGLDRGQHNYGTIKAMGYVFRLVKVIAFNIQKHMWPWRPSVVTLPIQADLMGDNWPMWKSISFATDFSEARALATVFSSLFLQVIFTAGNCSKPSILYHERNSVLPWLSI